MNMIRVLTSVVAGSMLTAVIYSAALSAPQHGIAMHGEPALSADFKNLPYVNPDAPQGGMLRQAITGTFDSTSPFIVKGTSAIGVRTYVFESLMGRNWDEAFSLYGLLAESIDVSEQRLALVDRVELNFDLENEHAAEHPLGPLQNAQLRALRVKLEKIDHFYVVVGAPHVQRGDVDLDAIGLLDALQLAKNAREPGDRRVHRRTRRFGSHVEAHRASGGSERGRDVFGDAVAPRVAERSVETFAFLRIRIEAVHPEIGSESRPALGDAPASSDVDDGQR